MKTISYNTRTLAACAKRLHWITERIKPADMPAWAIVWRFQEGFRFQVATEMHESDGWMAYSSVWNGAADLARDVEAGRADHVGIESLDLILQHMPDTLSDDQLRMLITQETHPETGKLALGQLCERTRLKVTGKRLATH